MRPTVADWAWWVALPAFIVVTNIFALFYNWGVFDPFWLHVLGHVFVVMVFAWSGARAWRRLRRSPRIEYVIIDAPEEVCPLCRTYLDDENPPCECDDCGGWFCSWCLENENAHLMYCPGNEEEVPTAISKRKRASE